MNLAKQLHKLGAFSYTHPWRVVSGWVIIMALLGFGASQFYTSPSSDISIPGTQGQETIDRVAEIFPEGGGGSGRIVFHAKDGTINDYKSEITSLITKVNTVAGVAQTVSPFQDASFISQDKTIAYSQVQLDQQVGSIDVATLSDVEQIVKASDTKSLQIEIGGGLVSSAPGEIIGAGEIIGVAVALLVLVITLGSLIAGGMPILSALTAIGVSMASLFSLSKLVDINSTTPVLAVMLGLAVGIDYSLFIVNKYRTLVIGGLGQKVAAARALGTAGNAVVFAAFTVIIALAALTVVKIPFMTTMGLAGAASIAVAAIVSLTLTPALMGIAKEKIFTKKQRSTKVMKQAKKAITDHNSLWYRWGSAITRRPIPVLLLAIIAVGIVATPALSLRLGLPTDEYASSDSTERKAYDLLSDGFGVGFNAPLIVLVEGLPKVSQADKDTVRSAALKEYNTQSAAAVKKQQALFQQQSQAATTPAEQAALQQSIQQAKISGAAQQKAAMAKIDTNVEMYAKYVQLNKIVGNIRSLKNVEQVQPALVNKDGTAGIVQVIPKTAPAASETADLITTLRRDDTTVTTAGKSKVRLAVTGSAALEGDINKKLSDALPLYLLTIVGLSFILLLIAFRSILVPIKATLGYVLSVLAMFGAIVAVFQWGWFGISDAVGPIVSFVPIIAAGILFGLAMDYEFFLVSGMHEAFHNTKDAKKSVVEGFGAGAKVVTAAAIIMVSVFSGFIFSSESVIQSIGFGLAVGILIDAFIVRMTIVPAVMTLLGKSAWWLPMWLDKRLPHVSIEGESEV